jgi:hypothetical protein
VCVCVRERETQVPTAGNTSVPKIPVHSGAMRKTMHLNYKI